MKKVEESSAGPDRTLNWDFKLLLKVFGSIRVLYPTRFCVLRLK